MKTFDEVTRTQKETAAVIFISLTFIVLLVSSMVIPNIIARGMLTQLMFYFGVIFFGAVGFLALEIVTALGFLGDGVKFGASGFVLLLIIGAWTGGNYMVAFISGSIVGVILFYGKSVFAIYRNLSIETRQEEMMLTVTELFDGGPLNHYRIEGIGANFELFYNIIEELQGSNKVMFYARVLNKEEDKLDIVLGDTMRFYANHMLPLHRVVSKRSSNVIKQMCFEGISPGIIERGLINYWSRAHLNGGYTSIMVPYESDFLEKAAACEGSYEEELPVEMIMNGSEWLLMSDSLAEGIDSHIDMYTLWDADEVKDKISKVYPVA